MNEAARSLLAGAESLPSAPEFVASVRRAGREAFEREGLPTTRQEDWRFTSNSRADRTFLKLFIFFISTLVPSFAAPFGRRDIFASHLRLPFSMSQSDTLRYLSIDFSFVR